MLEISVKKIDERVCVKGNKDVIGELTFVVSSSKDQNGCTYECRPYIYGFDNVAQGIEIPIQVLNNSKDGNSVIEKLLDLIKTNPQAVRARTHYLLEYWAYETKMIRDGKSLIQPKIRMLEMAAFAHNHVSSSDELTQWGESFHQQLTRSVVLIDLLDKFKHYSCIPPIPALFDFLEKITTASMNFNPIYFQKTVFLSPIYPENWQIKQFITSIKSSLPKVNDNNAFSSAKTMGEIGFLPNNTDINVTGLEQQKGMDLTPPSGRW